MEASDDQDGAASMAGLWRDSEGYNGDDRYLILSGGDNWSGPAISTWFQGESMTAVMNAMAYDASAIGNHEFDFKIEGLQAREAEANFPYLSANIRVKATGEIPDFATPYVVEESDGARVGIVGLSSLSTPFTTFPTHVEDYEFIGYQEALEAVLPQVRAQSVDFVILLTHLTGSEMRDLAPYAAAQEIPLILGGHSHEIINETVAGVSLMQTGSYMRGYGRVDLAFDPQADGGMTLVTSLMQNKNGQPVAAVAAVVNLWRQRTDAELATEIGYADAEINRYQPALPNMVTDSWLWAMPQADVALTNSGGIRQSIPAGSITLATIVGVLPFENHIVQLDLTGDQLIECAQGLEMAGLTHIDGWKLADGSAVHPDSVYQVLTIDYLYSRTDNKFSTYDTEPYETGVHYRQPVIDWIKSLATSPVNPLNGHLDTVARK